MKESLMKSFYNNKQTWLSCLAKTRELGGVGIIVGMLGGGVWGGPGHS